MDKEIIEKQRDELPLRHPRDRLRALMARSESLREEKRTRLETHSPVLS